MLPPRGGGCPRCLTLSWGFSTGAGPHEEELPFRGGRVNVAYSLSRPLPARMFRSNFVKKQMQKLSPQRPDVTVGADGCWQDLNPRLCAASGADEDSECMLGSKEQRVAGQVPWCPPVP